MKVFQVRENRPQQILVFPKMAMKGVQKNGTIQAIEHVFVWRIVCKQCVPSMSIRISRKENVKVLVEIGLSGLSSRKCEFHIQNS
jgi:hypothetical protein